MKLNALLMSRNQPTSQLVASVLGESQLRSETCDSAQEAIELMARGNYSAIVLDFDLPGAVQVAKLARLAPSQSRPVVFAMLGAASDVAEAYGAGANFVLYKPLAEEQVARSIRAARGFMRADRRRRTRHEIQTVVYLLFGKAAIPTLMVDVSENGLCLQAAEPLPSFDTVSVHFLLPNTSRAIEGKAEVVWADDSGRAGLFFTQFAPQCERRLKTWLRKNAGSKTVSRSAGTIGFAVSAAARS